MHTIESVYHNLEATLLREVALHEAIKELLSSQRSAILDRQPRHLMEVASLINARIAEAAILKTQREAAMHTLILNGLLRLSFYDTHLDYLTQQDWLQ